MNISYEIREKSGVNQEVPSEASPSQQGRRGRFFPLRCKSGVNQVGVDQARSKARALLPAQVYIRWKLDQVGVSQALSLRCLRVGVQQGEGVLVAKVDVLSRPALRQRPATRPGCSGPGAWCKETGRAITAVKYSPTCGFSA
jgi:hypothetical protein